jgi:hypothetical protein
MMQSKILLFEQKTLNQETFLTKNVDDGFLNSIWFFKPFDEAILTANLRRINDLARNLSLFFPDFWEKYTQIKTKAVEKFCENMYKNPPKEVTLFANWPIDKVYIPVELHTFDDCYTEKITNIWVVTANNDNAMSRVSTYLRSLMFDEFLSLIKSYDLEDFLTLNPAPKYFINQSDFDLVTRIFDVLLFNSEFETNLIPVSIIEYHLKGDLYSFFKLRLNENIKYHIDMEQKRVIIDVPHVVYDDGGNYIKMRQYGKNYIKMRRYGKNR